MSLTRVDTTTTSHTHILRTTQWSQVETVEAVVDDLYRTHVSPLMRSKGLDPKTTHWLILWDVYAIHKNKAMRERLEKKYPTLKFLFVPANCTSVLQPLDISFNSHFKKVIKTHAAAWMSEVVKRQLDSGKSIEDVKLPLHKSHIAPQLCTWLLRACEWGSLDVSSTQVIRSGWVKSGLDLAFDEAKRGPLVSHAFKLDATHELWDNDDVEEVDNVIDEQNIFDDGEDTEEYNDDDLDEISIRDERLLDQAKEYVRPRKPRKSAGKRK